MKKNYLMAGALFLLSCSQDTLPDYSTDTIELVLNQRVSGTISRKGEVDNYHFRAVEANNILKVKCVSNTLRPEVDLLVTVYRLDENGKKVIMFADHAREGSLSPADITMNIFIEKPQDIYLAVRDLNDDDFSSNSYYLSVDFGTAPEGNDTFSEADHLTVDNPDSCKADTIGYIGDVDVYTFTAPSSGIYEIQAEFSPFHGSSDVDLSVDLYDSSGVLVTTFAEKHLSFYKLLPYLPQGKYYILLDDYGKDSFDTASPFKICVNSVSSDEQFENDSPQNASVLQDLSSISGSLDYLGDQDWYRVSLPTGQPGVSVVYLEFDDSESVPLNYLVKFIGPDGRVLLSHTYRGMSGGYSTRIKGLAGDNYLVIQPAEREQITEKAPYRATVKMMSDMDVGESMGNSIDDSVPLQSGESVTGKIAFRGDEDWYSISADIAGPQILELFFNAPASAADYDIVIIRDGVEKRVFDADGSDGPTNLKTSILVPDESGTVTYSVKVADYQGDNGDDVFYTLKVNLVPVPQSLPGEGTFYYNEGDEHRSSRGNEGGQNKIEMIVNAVTQKKFQVNTTMLNTFYPPEGTVVSDSEERVSGSTVALKTVEFPWIGGFIDYQGDHDWFQVPNEPLFQGDTSWYYDIKIETRSDAPGSLVEYVWRYYPDRNNNRRVMLGDSGSMDDGMMASAGDTSTEIAPLDITVPRNSDEKFWIGDKWKGNTFLSMSDFNFVGETAPEDDWGYDAPYYFKVTLTYHSGVSYPGDLSVD